MFTPPAPASDVLGPADEDARVAALDTYLLALGPEPDPQADRAMALVDLVRTDRTVRRVDELARAEGLSSRSLQRLFAAYVGVGPKWVILRYRIHEALERAESEQRVDWAELAAELGYSDQAHLVRDFTATVGVPPTAFAPHRTPFGRTPVGHSPSTGHPLSVVRPTVPVWNAPHRRPYGSRPGRTPIWSCSAVPTHRS